MLGSRIAILRRNRGMSQATLARELHISPSTIGMYEQGRRNPPHDILIALSQTFHVSIDYLLLGNVTTPQDRVALEQILSDILK